MDLISKGDYGRIIAMIGKAESMEGPMEKTMETQSTATEAKDVEKPDSECAPCASPCYLGYTVTVKDGASKWMKDHGYWMEDMGDSIDGQQGVIVADYMHLGGNDSHFGIDFGNGEMIGVHPEWVQREKCETCDGNGRVLDHNKWRVDEGKWKRSFDEEISVECPDCDGDGYSR